MWLLYVCTDRLAMLLNPSDIDLASHIAFKCSSSRSVSDYCDHLVEHGLQASAVRPPV